ncbi:MAG TPA: hypothetical protein VLA02_07580 [Reyranella sp.]|nr:hypothetical protein [Reyranella sp.]
MAARPSLAAVDSTTAGGGLEVGLKALGKDAHEPVMADSTAIN